VATIADAAYVDEVPVADAQDRDVLLTGTADQGIGPETPIELAAGTVSESPAADVFEVFGPALRPRTPCLLDRPPSPSGAREPPPCPPRVCALSALR